MKKQKLQLQNDIMELLEQIRYERESIEPSQPCKNYSEYRKLIQSLLDLFNTYIKLNSYKNDEFVLLYKEEILKESQTAHNLMRYALMQHINEQYRCLNSVYIKLLEELKKIENREPLEVKADLNNEDGFKKLETFCEFSTKPVSCISKDIICDCKKAMNSQNYYKNIYSQEYIPYCKECIKTYVSQNSNNLFHFLQKINYPYINKLWRGSNNNIGLYFKILLFSSERIKNFGESDFI